MQQALTYVRTLYAITKQYLLRTKFFIRMDQMSIKELLSQTIQTLEQQCFVIKMLGYDFLIE